MGATTIDDVVWRWTNSNTAFFIRSIAAIPTKASTCTFSVRGILLMAYLLNLSKMSHTLERYWAMRPFLASFSPWICPITSWESLHISSLDANRARARFNPDRMTSYSTSLLESGNPSRIAYSSCSLVGDCKRRPTPDPETRDAPSTWRIHHPSSLGLTSWDDFWGISAMKSTMTCPFMANLGWYLISYSLNSMTRFGILSDMSGLCKILWVVDLWARLPDGLESKG